MVAYQHTADGRTGFERQLRSAYPAVYDRVARRFKDAQLAEEVSHDALAHAFELWRGDADYFNRHDLACWASQRAAWRALDCLRQRGRLRPLPEEHGGDEPTVRPRGVSDPEVQRRQQLTWECVRRLPEEDRRLIEGRYYEHRTDRQLGDELFGRCAGAQANTLRVWRRRRRALRRLRTILRQHGIDGVV